MDELLEMIDNIMLSLNNQRVVFRNTLFLELMSIWKLLRFMPSHFLQQLYKMYILQLPEGNRQDCKKRDGCDDLWQLGFSYQVNPLAAVQPLAAATRQGQ
ncbi:protein APEM9 [Trifolium repens]|nr:protein APEM9 [Trifolium repens]